MGIIPRGTWQRVWGTRRTGWGSPSPHQAPSGAGLTFRTARLGLCWRPGPPRGGAAGPPASGCSPHPASGSGSTSGRCRRTPRPASPWCSAAPGSLGCRLRRGPIRGPVSAKAGRAPIPPTRAIPPTSPAHQDAQGRGQAGARPRNIRWCHVNPSGLLAIGFPNRCILWVLAPRGPKHRAPQPMLDQAPPFPQTWIFPAPEQLVGFAFPRKTPWMDSW